MASGLEIAGLALATLPLIINQLDNYARGIERIRVVRRYRRTVSGYALRLETQYIIFSNNIKLVLGDIINDEERVSQLIQNPHIRLWKDASLQRELEQKLGRNYRVFVGNMLRVHETLRDLGQRLGVDVFNDNSDDARMAVRLRNLFFTAVYDDLLQQISDTNDVLNTLIEQYGRTKGSKAEPQGEVERLKQGLLQTRQYAKDLHDVVTRHVQLDCGCNKYHRAFMRLLPTIGLDGTGDIGRLRLILNQMNGRDHGTHSSWWEVEAEPRKITNTVTVRAVGIQEQHTESMEQDQLPLGTVKSAASVIGMVSSNEPAVKPVTHLCSLLAVSNKLPEGQPLGYLEAADYNTQYLVKAIINSETLNRESLVEALPQTTRQDRLRIAARIACGVVQFHGSWLQRDWNISDIDLSHDLQLMADRGITGIDSLLYYSKALTPESAGTRSRDMHTPCPAIRNPILFPLGLALIELSLGKSVADLQVADDLAGTDAISKLNTASRLLNKVYSESGSSYGDVVNQCLFWSGIGPLTFDDSEFERDVLYTVVSPLLQDLSHFEGNARRMI
ncbi:hypothetical protein BDW62DRAFT_205659 [Aspergillus aurantiobrunneus]